MPSELPPSRPLKAIVAEMRNALVPVLACLEEIQDERATEIAADGVPSAIEDAHAAIALLQGLCDEAWRLAEAWRKVRTQIEELRNDRIPGSGMRPLETGEQRIKDDLEEILEAWPGRSAMSVGSGFASTVAMVSGPSLDSSGGALPRREWKDFALVPRVLCSVCQGLVRRVPGGTCCEQGHGGAPLVPVQEGPS